MACQSKFALMYLLAAGVEGGRFDEMVGFQFQGPLLRVSVRVSVRGQGQGQ